MKTCCFPSCNGEMLPLPLKRIFMIFTGHLTSFRQHVRGSWVFRKAGWAYLFRIIGLFGARKIFRDCCQLVTWMIHLVALTSG